MNNKKNITYALIISSFIVSCGGSMKPIGKKIDPFENCYGIYIGEKKIGYSCETLVIKTNKTKKNYQLSTHSEMQFSALGMTIASTMNSKALLDNNLKPIENEFIMSGPTGKNKITGRRNKQEWNVTRWANGQKLFEKNYPYRDIKLAETLELELIGEKLNVGDKKEYYVFNSELGDTAHISIEITEKKVLNWLNRKTTCYKVVNTTMGVKMVNWVTESGVLIESTAPMGIRMILEPKNIAKKLDMEAPPVDIISWTAIPVGKEIPAPRETNNIDYVIKGINPDLYNISDSRQVISNKSGDEFMLTVTSIGIPENSIPGNSHKYLEPSIDIQSNDTRLRTLAEHLTAREDNATKKVENIIKWMQENIKKEITFSVPSALEVLDMKQGDCGEFSVLFAALARAAKIPSTVVAGIVYNDKQFFYHAWNEVELNNSWFAVDASMNQTTVDATHIKLIEGETSNQLKLAEIVNVISITPLSRK